MRGTKLHSMFAAMFMAGAFLASPELRAYASTIANDVICNGCVATSDLASNAVTAAKIKDNEVKGAEIAADSVGGSELQGVTKLLFGRCVPSEFIRTTPVAPLVGWNFNCNIAGVDADDSAIATLNGSGHCFSVKNVKTQSNAVNVDLLNDCNVTVAIGPAATIAIMVYDK